MKKCLWKFRIENISIDVTGTSDPPADPFRSKTCFSRFFFRKRYFIHKLMSKWKLLLLIQYPWHVDVNSDQKEEVEKIVEQLCRKFVWDVSAVLAYYSLILFFNRLVVRKFNFIKLRNCSWSISTSFICMYMSWHEWFKSNLHNKKALHIIRSY